MVQLPELPRGENAKEAAGRQPSRCDALCRASAPQRRHKACRAQAQTQPHKKAVVVGAGVGGICLAGRLAKRGFDVTNVEKNPEAGGRAQTVQHGAFRFDTGPSLLLFPDTYRQAFEALGSRIEEHVDLIRVAPAAYRVHYADGGGHLDLLNDVGEMQQQLEAVEPGAGQKYLAFLAQARGSLRMGLPNFIEQDFARLSDVAKLPRVLAGVLPSLRHISLPQILGPHESMLKQYFDDYRIRGLFSFQDLYVGLSPYNAPGVYSLLAGTELTDGVWYPRGGFRQVVDGLLNAASACGARFLYDAEVVSIDAAGSRATGVTLASGEQIAADIVVSNRDVPAAYPLLRGDDSSREHGSRKHDELSAKQFSAGVISFNWSVRRRFPELQHHNVFLSDKGEAAWRRARSAEELQRNPNFYVHVPSRSDPTAAPADGDSVMVLLPVANMQESGTDNYVGLIEAGRRAVFRTFEEAGIGDVSSHIVHEEVISPPQWRQRYGLQHGAAFGLSHGLDQLSVFRPSIIDSEVAGLYFVGASTRPGNGVPLCMISAALADEHIASDLAAGVF